MNLPSKIIIKNVEPLRAALLVNRYNKDRPYDGSHGFASAKWYTYEHDPTDEVCVYRTKTGTIVIEKAS